MLAVVLSSLGFGQKAALLSPLCFAYKPGGEGRPRSFHPKVLATNRAMQSGTSVQKCGLQREFTRELARHAISVALFAFRLSCVLRFARPIS